MTTIPLKTAGRVGGSQFQAKKVKVEEEAKKQAQISPPHVATSSTTKVILVENFPSHPYLIAPMTTPPLESFGFTTFLILLGIILSFRSPR